MDGTFTMQGNVTSVRGATDYRQWCGRVRNRNETEVISKVMLFQTTKRDGGKLNSLCFQLHDLYGCGELVLQNDHSRSVCVYPWIQSCDLSPCKCDKYLSFVCSHTAGQQQGSINKCCSLIVSIDTIHSLSSTFIKPNRVDICHLEKLTFNIVRK